MPGMRGVRSSLTGPSDDRPTWVGEWKERVPPEASRRTSSACDSFYGGITSGGGLVWRARPSWWSRPGEAVDPMGGILRSVTSRMPLP